MGNHYKKIGKRAATPTTILILVIMALLIYSMALFVFLTNDEKAEAKISNARFIGKVYVKEEQARFYVGQIAQDAYDFSYDEKNGEVNKEKFAEAFEKLAEGKDELNPSIEDINERIKRKEYELEIEGKILTLNFKNFQIAEREVVKEEKPEKIIGIIPTPFMQEETEIKQVIYKSDLEFVLKPRV